MKARKCIMKAGSLDKYLLNTKAADIDSKFGLYLRDLIKKKQKDPNFRIPYIPGSARLPRTRKTTVFEYKQIPAIYMPAHVKIGEDHSKYFNKAPSEMSRFEIAKLEQMLKELDEPEVFVPDEEMYASQEFKDLKEQLKQIQPIRHAMIKKFFDKFKYMRNKRDLVLELAEDAEEGIEEVLGDEYVHFKDAIPEIKQFLAEVEAREKLRPALQPEEEEKKEEAKEKAKKKGKKEKKEKKAKRGEEVAEESEQSLDKRGQEAFQIEEIDFNPEKFNPFDQSTIKKEKQNLKPMQKRKVLVEKK